MFLNKFAQAFVSAALVALSSALVFPLAVSAHNNVVVIPMAGDDIVPEPSSPVTKESPDNSDYIVNGLFSVVDKITGLEWQRLDDNNTRTWSAAFDYCLSLELDGKDDWRLPLLTELQSIVDYNDESPAINSSIFPATDSSSYWSQSPVPQTSSGVWAVSFTGGSVTGFGQSLLFYSRCVR